MASAAPVSLSALHPVTLDGTAYVFRTPDIYDPARARRLLGRQGVRRPGPMEFRVAAQAGVTALAETAGDPAEGARQAALLDDWYALSEPIAEDDIDEPDLDLRTAELARRRAEQTAGQHAIWAQIAAIEANLERHWMPYAELKTDRVYWDDVSRIDLVRLLLVSRDGAVLLRDDDGLVTQSLYASIKAAHREPLATFAFRLLAPDETQRKN